jgi:hypothetical protein
MNSACFAFADGSCFTVSGSPVSASYSNCNATSVLAKSFSDNACMTLVVAAYVPVGCTDLGGGVGYSITCGGDASTIAVSAFAIVALVANALMN